MRISPTRIRITTQPTIEPVSRTEAKLHLRIDHATEDDLIDRLITTARIQCEDIAGRSFITRTYTAKFDLWPRNDWMRLPFPPLISVSSITYTDEDGNTATYAANNYIVDTYSEPGQLVIKTDSTWPDVTLQEVNGITVVYTAGYGALASDVPAHYRQAVLLMVGHLYENREAVLVGNVNATELPMALNALLLTDRGGWW